MPVMTGVEATERIRKELPPERQPWIIGLTANAMNGDSKRCFEAGMNDYVPKPIRREDLAAALSRIGQVVAAV